jgi:flagellar biosynthesis protein FliQ
MDVSEAITWGQYSVMTVALLSGPPLLVAMVTGLLISLFQALTQIQEMTLVFVPKIVAVILTMTLMGGWMLTQAVTFGERAFSSAAVINN